MVPRSPIRKVLARKRGSTQREELRTHQDPHPPLGKQPGKGRLDVASFKTTLAQNNLCSFYVCKNDVCSNVACSNDVFQIIFVLSDICSKQRFF